MVQLKAQETFLTDHASDADARKSWDPSEDPKHYIDLESYADFRHLPADLSIVVAQYGWPMVESNGILPWAIAAAADSLTAQFRRGDWEKAYQSAADIGHYVGDAYQPLHCTVNYNGQLTGNYGIHSQYETRMLGQYLATLSVPPDTVSYVNDVYAHALNTAIHSNAFVDSIMQADSAARAASGWTGSGTPSQVYYATLWERTGAFTRELLQDATRDIASLWYTAWVNAGVTAVEGMREPSELPSTIALDQNWPNPFNPRTNIRYSFGELGSGQQAVGNRVVKLAVYDLLGREVAVLVDEEQQPGKYTVTWNAASVASGVYLYRLKAAEASVTKTMQLLR